jgi:uncharacterized lipoprotein YmbA
MYVYRRIAMLTMLLGAMSLSACTTRSRTRLEELTVQEQYAQQEAGVNQFIWEEPMIDVVDVPPGLDPEGHYYRPAHQEVLEIRQGRWQYHRPE